MKKIYHQPVFRQLPAQLEAFGFVERKERGA
jgi:hypothetical protein